MSVTETLAKEVPSSALMVSESGIYTAADIARVKAVGASAVLVGESLMRQDKVEQATRALLAG
ncbi:MAG: hypothetical protein COA85_04145 [Robiginitomaculum sp.]|nr:MAG: hypothetical protein COA85_04145 [Robiginitomaculum sp.]